MSQGVDVLENSYLDPPDAKDLEFKSNLLDTVVCELRFPALLHLETEKPTEFASKLRSKFPIYQPGQTATLTPAGPTTPTANYTFSKRHRESWVGLTATSLSYSTNAYKNFDIFLNEINEVLVAILPLLETNFFTRLGLRYVNRINIGNSHSDLNGRVNDHLSGLIEARVLGPVMRHRTTVEGGLETAGNYTFQYGLEPDHAKSGGSGTSILLDFDYYVTDIDSNAVTDTLTRFHKTHFNFFWWTLGEKTKETLLNNVVAD